MRGMDTIDDAELDRLVHALVMWGATASQIVAHMEHTQRSGASRSQRSTVRCFSGLVRELAAPVVSRHAVGLAHVARTIEAIDAEVSSQVLLVPLAGPNRAARRRRGGH